LEPTYIKSLLYGLLTFVSPCILPMLPIYYSYLAGGIAGQANNEGGNHKERLLINSIGFVLGFSTVFVLLGAAATSIGAFLRSHRDEFVIVSGIIIILFGLNFLGILKIGILNVEKRFDYRFERLKFFSSVIFGMVFSFGWTGCIVSYLTPVMAMAADSEMMAEGLLMLTIYSLGLGIPFIVSALIFEKLKKVFKFVQKNYRIINIISGLFLIYSGISMIYPVVIKLM